MDNFFVNSNYLCDMVIINNVSDYFGVAIPVPGITDPSPNNKSLSTVPFIDGNVRLKFKWKLESADFEVLQDSTEIDTTFGKRITILSKKKRQAMYKRRTTQGLISDKEHGKEFIRKL